VLGVQKAEKLFMRKILASVGLVALGSALQTVSAQSLDIPRPSKPWDVSLTLRGFYDDNPSTLPNSSPDKQGSYGFEVSPNISAAWSLETTTIKLGYLYSMKYYETKPVNNTDNIDQSHSFDLAIDHAFSEQYRAGVKDSFVIGQEPDMLRAGNSISTPFRVPGDNIRNYGAINFDGNLTRQIGFGVGYDNAFYDYADTTQITDGAGNVLASTGGLLNRIENGVHLDGKWIVTPETTGILGFMFRQTGYTADELVGGNVTVPSSLVTSSDRDNYIYTPNVGVEHSFLPDLSGSLRVGASYVDYYNSSSSDNNWSPYVQASLRYFYMKDSFLQLGFSHDMNATDIIGAQTAGGAASFTQNVESSTVYGTLKHSFTPVLFGTVTGQYQHSVFQGGSVDNESDDYFLAGLNLQYRFTQNFSAEAGYNYDGLSSEIVGRSYQRNRVYIGLTGSY
jgi:hypothetical protein